ncbi:hypothetical protein [Halobacillus sp. Marseille-Q1614]|uniref:hypothetical protein n=1 Tax=Halobacillus sp. Marseille-Q1614 TaxID=2709134 RepID=UPI00157129D4|nr:hypothetical protein [Halobacillus sp. Marseille-Q1614]
MNKSPILAFFLAFIPGFGHMYLGRAVRGILYPLVFFGILAAAFFTVLMNSVNGRILAVFLIAALFIWAVNMLDMVITLLLRNKNSSVKGEATSLTAAVQLESEKQNERFFTILLSFVPGVGHFQMGLKQRGLTFLAIFLGSGTMIIFVTLLTSQSGFLVFLPALLVIWVYSLFDAIQALNKKQAGEPIEDRPLMEDLNELRIRGEKSGMLATVLAIFPGAGHMYLGLQKRGLQLMLGFLAAIYVLDVLRLSLFLFLIPVIWFYSFFDALQQTSNVKQGRAEDRPIIKNLHIRKGLIGGALIVLGIYYLIDTVLFPLLADDLRRVFHIDIWYYYQRYFQVVLVSAILIGSGLYLLKKNSNREVRETE